MRSSGNAGWPTARTASGAPVTRQTQDENYNLRYCVSSWVGSSSEPQ